MSKPRVALITGAGRGLGYGLAQALAASMHCVLVDRDSAVMASAAGLPSPLGAAEAVTADMTDENAVADLINGVFARHGRLDVLINNAGINPRHPEGRPYTVEEISLDQWERVIRTNLTAVFTASKLAIPKMRAGKWGRIINISSRTARTYTGTAAADYASSKAGVLALTRQIAAEEGKHGITANCIAPGPILSPMTAVEGDVGVARRAGISLVGRIGKPEEIGATAKFLCSEEAGYITGAIIDVNGGSYMP